MHSTRVPAQSPHTHELELCIFKNRIVSGTRVADGHRRPRLALELYNLVLGWSITSARARAVLWQWMGWLELYSTAVLCLFVSRSILSPKPYPKLSETPRGAAEALPKFLAILTT